MTGGSFAALLAERVRADPAGPLLTYYGAAGERVELSARTFDNWVAKTANLLRDVLGARPGTRVGLLLPPHWQSAVVLAATWRFGAIACPGRGDAEVVFAAEARLAEARGEEVVGLCLAPLGGRLTAAGPGVVDYAAEIAAMADTYDGPAGAADAPALQLDTATYRVGQLRELGEQAGLALGTRVLSVLGLDSPEGLAAGLLVPLARQASAVLCPPLDAGELARLAATERVTATAGVQLPGLARLD